MVADVRLPTEKQRYLNLRLEVARRVRYLPSDFESSCFVLLQPTYICYFARHKRQQLIVQCNDFTQNENHFGVDGVN